MKRSYFLKYSCILLMLSSLVRLFFAIMMINFFATAKTFGAAENSMLHYAGWSFACSIACAAAELTGGFVGALNWEEPLHAGKCVIWGLAALLAGLLANWMQKLSGYGISYVAWITGCAVPLIFLTAGLHFLLSQRRV